MVFSECKNNQINKIQSFKNSCVFNDSQLQIQLQEVDYGHYSFVGISGCRSTENLAMPILQCGSLCDTLHNENQI